MLKCHIFIDQVKPDIGGVGKSGLEAIALDCVTLCSINHLNKNYIESKYYPKHPIIDIENSDDVYKEIVNLVTNKEYYNEKLEATRNWKKYISYENTIKRIESFIEERGIR